MQRTIYTCDICGNSPDEEGIYYYRCYDMCERCLIDTVAKEMLSGKRIDWDNLPDDLVSDFKKKYFEVRNTKELLNEEINTKIFSNSAVIQDLENMNVVYFFKKYKINELNNYDKFFYNMIIDSLSETKKHIYNGKIELYKTDKKHSEEELINDIINKLEILNKEKK